jgi:hypothetical protein
VTNANEIASVASYRASGPIGSSATPSSSASGYGSSQVTSPSRVGSGGSTSGTDQSIRGRRRAERSVLRQRLVATRYSQVRNEARS